MSQVTPTRRQSLEAELILLKEQRTYLLREGLYASAQIIQASIDDAEIELGIEPSKDAPS